MNISKLLIRFFFPSKRIEFFLYLQENIFCGYSLEVPQGGAFNGYPQHVFIEK